MVDPTLAIPHVGYAIGAHVGGAVVRNQLRRRLQAIMKIHNDDLVPGWYLCGVSVAARTYGYAQLAENVERLIKAIQAHHIRGSIQ
mgnify:CR=1 FL=1